MSDDPLLQYRCPPLLAWLTEHACARLRQRAEKARKVGELDVIRGRGDLEGLRLPCPDCPGVRGLHESGETGAPRKLRVAGSA
jgi:hypothetical protein